MKLSALMLLICPLLCVASCAQPAGAALRPLPHVVIETSVGDIELVIETEKAPISAANFLSYVDGGTYAGGSFYRTVRPGNDNSTTHIQVIQGGLGLTAEADGKGIAHEDTRMTGLTHSDGAISLARDAPGTASSEFFICIGENGPALDAGGGRNKDGAGFAVFGHVVRGMEVVRAIQAMRADGPSPDPYMNNQILNPPVTITGMRRL